MVEIVKIPKNKMLSLKNCRTKEDYYERSALRKITSKRKSEAFREAVAANIPVTYAENGVIYREVDGKRTEVGRL